MALRTQGFALSSMPHAPNIPANAGAVDVKEIYDGVRQGLAAFETARRAPASMLLADAEMAAGTAEAPMGTRQVLAQTEGLEQQTPLKTAILAAEASPEMLEAKRQALLNRSVKALSGDIQLANSLAAAQLRLAEDPTDAQAAQLVAVLGPMALKKSATSAANPQGVIDAGVQKTADTNATRVATTTETNQTRRDIAFDANAMRVDLAQRGFTQSEINARIAAEGRVNAARASNLNKAYQTAAEQNQQIQTALGSLALLEEKADQYLESSLGSGPVVGSTPGLFVRAVFGDTTGQELKAAIGQEMTNAVKTVQGLGAMSNIEFGAVMEQLPKATDQGPAMVTKLEYLKAIRPWLAARSNLYMSELERGASPVSAYQKVRTAFPVPPVSGATELAQTRAAPAPASVATAAALPEFATPEEADAAGAAGTIQSGAKITVGGRPATWVAP